MRVTALLLSGVLLSGCVVSVGGGSHSRHERPKGSAPVVVVGNTEDAALMAEIDAAGKLSFDSGRVAALQNIASRPALDSAAQVHLVNAAFERLEFEASKLQVLMTLIQNPALSPAGKEAIFRQIDRLEFDGSKRQVIDAIQQRAAAGGTS
jgi:hypothetical protein